MDSPKETIRAHSPATGALLVEIRATAPGEVMALLAAARAAFPAWRDLPIGQRLDCVTRLRKLLVERLDEVVALVAAATGKPDVEALASDVLVSVDVLRYYEREARQILADEPRRGTLLYRLSKFLVTYQPMGAVAVIAPWNHPLQLALVPAVAALIAGNTVLLKPSELTPTVGQLIAELGADAGLPRGALTVLQGGPEVGKALVAAGPDKIFFTGSLATGRAILAAAAEGLIPVSLELGGNDPMIVFEDADLGRAVAGATYGAFANAGQNCVAVERLYVQRSIHDRFLARVTEAAERLRVGSGREADLGPIISDGQREKLTGLLEDALGRGARPTTPIRWEGNRLHPVVLAGVDHSMRIMQTEVFGPILPVMPFDSEDEAVALANDSPHGLNSSVWTRDASRARRVARRLVTGSCAINDVLKNIGNPTTPFGGVRQSGLGKSHGPEGLRAFCHQRVIMTNPQTLGAEPNWFPYGDGVYQALSALIRALHGDDAAPKKLWHLAKGMSTAIFGHKAKDEP